MIYFNGCSFTYGYELKKLEDRFSTVLCNKLGVEEWNVGKIGSSNARIWRTTMTDIMLQKPKLVILMWSGPNREEYLHFARGKWGWKNATWKQYAVDSENMKVLPTCNVSRNVDQSEADYHYLNGYMKVLRNTLWNMRYTIHYMLSIKYFLKTMNIPHLDYTFSSTQYLRGLEMLDTETWDCTSIDAVSIEMSRSQVLKELPFIANPGFYDLCKLNNLPIGEKDHPLEEAHAWMAEKIIKDIKKKKYDRLL